MAGVAVTEGIGKNVATSTVTRNSQTEEIQLVRLSLGAKDAHDNEVDSGEQPTAAAVPVVQAADVAAFETLTTLAFGSVSTVYALLKTPTLNQKYIEIQNQLDLDIIVSLDAGVTDHWRIPAKEPRIFDLGQYHRYQAAAIHIKSVGGSPTEGEVRLMAWG